LLILSALDFIVTEALTALAKPEEILPPVFSSVCNWGISQSKLPSPTGISASLLGAIKASMKPTAGKTNIIGQRIVKMYVSLE
jgi:hypothetical protein